MTASESLLLELGRNLTKQVLLSCPEHMQACNIHDAPLQEIFFMNISRFTFLTAICEHKLDGSLCLNLLGETRFNHFVNDLLLRLRLLNHVGVGTALST
jgi:hypothetical protein